MTTNAHTKRPPAARTAVLAAIAALAMLAGLVAAVLTQKPSGASVQSGTLLKSPRPVPAFALTDESGNAYTEQDLRGHWTLIFPGFTFCPDVCPTTMGLLKTVQSRLGESADQLQVVLLSVDPDRDTPQVLERYVHFFSPRFKGVTTHEPALKTLAQALGVAYAKIPGDTPQSYTMDHSAALVLINPRGELAAYFTPPLQVDGLAGDLARLLESAS